MSELIIPGSQVLKGEIDISGAKNGILPLMVCSLLTQQDVIFSNVPNLSDVHAMISLMRLYGSLLEFDTKSKTLSINNSEISYVPIETIYNIRASIWLLAPILARCGKVKIPLPGGCGIGDKQSGLRQIDLHLDLLRSMGAIIKIEEGCVVANIDKKLQATNFHFAKISVGATINAILASVLAEGSSTLSGCAIEPEICEMCHFLVKIGAQIKGIGSRTLIISGVKSLSGGKQMVMPDRIEAGTYLIMAAITKGQVKVNGIDPMKLNSLCKALQSAGNSIEYFRDSIFLKSSKTIYPVNISTSPFPGFVTDLQAQFMSLMCLSSGVSFISENIYDNRFMHVKELNKMGANIFLCEDSKAKVVGVKNLTGTSVKASDLRASVCLVLAGLAGHGTTKLSETHHLKRGYENLDLKLKSCGIQLEWNQIPDIKASIQMA